MIRSFIVISKLKLKYAINVAHYNTKDKIFNKKREKLDFNNGFDAALKAFYDNFIKLFFLVLILIIVGCYSMEYLDAFNIESIIFIMIFISFAVGLIKSFIGKLNEDAIYSVEHLKIQPSYYIKSNYVLNLLFIILLFATSLLVVKEFLGLEILTYRYIFYISFIYASMRNVGVYYNIKSDKNDIINYIMGIVIILLGYFFVYSKFIIPIDYYNYIFFFIALMDIIIIRLIFKYKYYTEYYNLLHDKYIRKQVKLKQYETRQIIYEKSDFSLKKEKNPYKRFINIFEKRYKSSLPKKFTKSTIIIFVVFIYCGFMLINNEELALALYNDLQYGMTAFVLLLCMMNSGKKIIKHFFEKCDIYMNTHNFYMYQKVATKMYKAKLYFMIKTDLLKTNVLAFSIIILYYLTGENILPIEIISIFVSLNLVMIMFSMYYLTINLLYKPFENKLHSTKWFNIFLLYLPYYFSFTIFIKSMAIINFGVYILLIFIFAIVFNSIVVRKKIKNRT